MRITCNLKFSATLEIMFTKYSEMLSFDDSCWVWHKKLH